MSLAPVAPSDPALPPPPVSPIPRADPIVESQFLHPSSDQQSDAASTTSTSSDRSALSSASADSLDSNITTPDSDPTPIASPKMSASLSSTTADDSANNSTLTSVSATPDVVYAANDDSVIQYEPSQHVDYLSHNWQESDISSSWRYIVLRRKDVANSARLENASWRTWTKAKYNLKTVSPESVNWLKDQDVTWLYGPLYTQQSRAFLGSGTPTSPSAVDHASSNAGVPSPPLRATKKPILKKRSVSEVMLSRSVSSSNLLKQAAASVKAQRHLRAPGTTPTTASYSSAGSPYSSIVVNDRRDPRFPSPIVARSYAASSANFSDRLTSSSNKTQKTGETKHIHFSDRVEQCIALEVKEDDDDTSNSVSFSGTSSATSTDEEDAEDEPGLFLMVRSASGSFQRPATLEPHTIAKLPATKLKYVHDAEDRLQTSSHSTSRAAFFSMGVDGDDYDSDDLPEIEDENEEEDYISYGRHHRHRRHHHNSRDQPQSRYQDVSDTTTSTLVSRSSSSNLLSTSSSSNMRSSMMRPQIDYVEDSSSIEQADSDGSENLSDDDDDVVDMDSSLLASLRRDSVVLARGRINDIMLNNSSITENPSHQESMDDSLTTLRRPSSVNSSSTASSGPEPPKVVDSDEEADHEAGGSDEEVEEPRGFWGHVNQALSATKDLAVVFWKGGFQK